MNSISTSIPPPHPTHHQQQANPLGGGGPNSSGIGGISLLTSIGSGLAGVGMNSNIRLDSHGLGSASAGLGNGSGAGLMGGGAHVGSIGNGGFGFKLSGQSGGSVGQAGVNSNGFAQAPGSPGGGYFPHGASMGQAEWQGFTSPSGGPNAANGGAGRDQGHVNGNTNGQGNQVTTPGAPHLLPNNLAAHLNNPGMPLLNPMNGSVGNNNMNGRAPTPQASPLPSQAQAQNHGQAGNNQNSHASKLASTLLGAPPMLPHGQSLSNPHSPQPLHPFPIPPSSHTPNPHNGPLTTGSATGKILLHPSSHPPAPGSEEAKIYTLIAELLDPGTRETALLELSKKREMYEDLALVLWGGFGIMSSLLLEIVHVYPALSPPSLSAHASNRVCNALALLQCVASHAETRSLFLNAHIPLFLYPFLNTTSKTRPFEYLRLTSLGVIGALVKQNDNSDVINFLLSTEIIPLCLRIMETGSELSKTVAIFIVQKILLDDLGLAYICQTYERFYAVGTVLSNMVTALVDTQAVRLLKHVVRCYLRLSDNPRAREALRACLPDALRDGTFATLLKGDAVTKRCLTQLLQNLTERIE